MRRYDLFRRIGILLMVILFCNMLLLPGMVWSQEEEAPIEAREEEENRVDEEDVREENGEAEEEAGEEEPPAVDFDYDVKAALLMEADTGNLIFDLNIDEKLYPASITKIMTVLLVMEALEEGKVNLDDEVYISREAASMGGSQIFLSEGDRLSLEKLLIGILVGSANDASMSVAEHVSGSVEVFVEAMNNRALELGMKNTRFVNPHGLHDENHYSTAYDISIMSRELLNYPKVHELTVLWMDEHFLEGEIEAGEVFLSNTNKFIRYYKGCDGLKTGFTSEAEHCIAATALRGDTRFLTVILGGATSDDRYEAARTLLNHGFSRYQTVPVADKGDIIKVLPVEKGSLTQVNIIAADKLSLMYPRGEKVEYEKEISLPDRLDAPLEKGQKVGEITAVFGEEESSADLIVEQEVARAGYFTIAGRLFTNWLTFGR